MTITSTPSTARADAGRRRIGAACEAVARRLLAAFDAADQRQFHHLTDHMLRDMGLARDQIMRAPAGRRWGKLRPLQG